MSEPKGDAAADDESGTDAKWACEYCTYQNYRSALRCTMCAGSKPLLSEDIFRLSPSQPPPKSSTLTMARSKTPSPQPHPPAATSPQPTTNCSVPTAAAAAHLSPHRSPIAIAHTDSSAATPSPPSHTPTSPPIVAGAWSCPTCSGPIETNEPRCCQCGGSAPNSKARDQRRSEARHNDMNDQLKALSMQTIPAAVAASDPDLSRGAQSGGGGGGGGLHPAAPASAGRRRSNVGLAISASTNTTLSSSGNSTTTSPLGSASNLSGSRTNLGATARISPVDARLTAAAPFGPLGKWCCTLCTYENFPRSKKCSMCGHPKELQLHTSNSNLSGSSASMGDSRSLIAAQPRGLSPGDGATDVVDAAAAASASPERGAMVDSGSGDDSGGGGGGGGNNCASNYIISSGRAAATVQQQQQQQQQQHQQRQSQNSLNRYQLVAPNGGGAGGGGGGAIGGAADNANVSAVVSGAAAAASNNCDNLQERRYRQMRRQADWQWLHACLGVVENNYGAVEAYLSCGGNPGRTLTATEVSLLNRNSAFDVGHTLIHLAIRFHRDEMLPMLLTQISGSGPGIKRVPSYVAPDLASDIRRHFANSLRCRKAAFPCQYVSEHATFALPVEIEELPITIQEQLHEELLDRDAQAQLECSPPALNWSLEITVRLGSRLMVLWNRSAGDCLLDSAMQATWGVFDRDNVLRRALADSLHQCGHMFYARWKEYEMTQAALLHFSLEEAQWQQDWATLLSLARQPGASLEQLHIFALAHILRRPIVVYGVKYVKSFRGEDIGFARFEGLYLPLMWDQSFCSKSPIALGYTRGHFSALVPVEPYTRIDAACVDAEDVLFLPLMDCEHKLLPIHFLTHAEMGREESIMRQWLDVCVTEGGLLVAQQKLQKRPLLVAQMLEEWLNHYRRIAQVVSGPFSRRRPLNHTGYSSDGDTDEE